MSEHERPVGLTETSVAMSVTNAMGWAIIDWSRPQALLTFIVFTLSIIIGYLVIWFYWKGKNWARIMILLGSVLALFNLRLWNSSGRLERVMIGAEAALALFLLYWLNTRKVKAFFSGTEP
jgi:uncharacterized membrane protein